MGVCFNNPRQSHVLLLKTDKMDKMSKHPQAFSLCGSLMHVDDACREVVKSFTGFRL